jgi:acetyl esterase
MNRSTFSLAVLLVVLAAVSLPGHAKAQVKTEKPDARLQQRLTKFPQADANGDGILTQGEAGAFQKSRKQAKAGNKSDPVRKPVSPTLGEMSYGPHERNKLDFWQAKSDHPTPVLLFFHGGSFKAGDKSILLTRPIFEECLQVGISVVSANYRFSSDAPYPAQMHDGARVVQFVRSKAKEWKIDPARIAVSGSSAGATLALWIALHDDLADPSSNDSVSRLSTRVTCASPHSGTAGLDSLYFQRQAGVSRQGAALWQLFGASSQADFDLPTTQTLAREASPLSHASEDDPPLFLTYQGDPSEAPFAPDAAQSNWIHHVCLGLPLRSKYDALGRECEFYYKSKPAADGAEIAFLKKHLLTAREAAFAAPQAASPTSYVY